MMFLLRLTFWIMLICLLLPGSREDNKRLISSAEKTVNDVRGFCDRNPDVCNDARTTANSLYSRLRSGAELLQNWLSNKRPDRLSEVDPSTNLPDVPTEPAPIYQHSDYQAQQTVPKVAPKYGDSLNPADKEVPWHGPSRL
jgi:Family of unknown function (DUF5330)